jgi:hypothetical protein
MFQADGGDLRVEDEIACCFGGFSCSPSSSRYAGPGVSNRAEGLLRRLEIAANASVIFVGGLKR